MSPDTQHAIQTCHHEAELRYRAATRLPAEHAWPLLVAALVLEGAAGVLAGDRRLPLVVQALGVDPPLAA